MNKRAKYTEERKKKEEEFFEYILIGFCFSSVDKKQKFDLENIATDMNKEEKKKKKKQIFVFRFKSILKTGQYGEFRNFEDKSWQKERAPKKISFIHASLKLCNVLLSFS